MLAAFSRANIAANLTASQLAVSGGTNVKKVIADRAGSVVGIAIAASINAAGATLTAHVYVNGADTLFHLDLTAGNSKAFATAANGTYTYVAGDVIDVRIDTPSGWTSTTLEAEVRLFVQE